eukprot:TRINITY_DN15772_c0_g2_i2.p1 TRINITY_DN15772_c0_g2~~TRINITY_DN15772_c0_g2_i2.p1  ORF type:complete len:382 (-),score=80.53 TRINITY_DN15772_c0_g2_i2:5-1150(-)
MCIRDSKWGANDRIIQDGKGIRYGAAPAISLGPDFDDDQIRLKTDHEPQERLDPPSEESCLNKWCSPSVARWCQVAGPGMVVMLADTDVGSIITASQTGAKWGYSILSIQFILIPILYITQQLTVTLGIVTGQGHGELIRDRYGASWAWLSVGTLVVACIGATISEISGIVGVGEIAGVPRQVSAPLVGLCLLAMAFSGSYRSVERGALVLGLFEATFLITMCMGDVKADDFFLGVVEPKLQHPNFLFLVAANIGAVIMPWMIFYQQSAVLDKGLTADDLGYAKVDTLVGSFVTQAIMCAVVITCASTIWVNNEGDAHLNSIQEISQALTPHIGTFGGQVLFSLAVFGAGCVASIVVSLTAAWGLGAVSYTHLTLPTKRIV